MLEISAQPFWQRFVFCFKMAFKRHALQTSMKDQIRARKRLLKAHKVAAGTDEVRALELAYGYFFGGVVLVGLGLIIFGAVR